MKKNQARFRDCDEFCEASSSPVGLVPGPRKPSTACEAYITSLNLLWDLKFGFCIFCWRTPTHNIRVAICKGVSSYHKTHSSSYWLEPVAVHAGHPWVPTEVSSIEAVRAFSVVASFPSASATATEPRLSWSKWGSNKDLLIFASEFWVMIKYHETKVGNDLRQASSKRRRRRWVFCLLLPRKPSTACAAYIWSFNLLWDLKFGFCIFCWRTPTHNIRVAICRGVSSYHKTHSSSH